MSEFNAEQVENRLKALASAIHKNPDAAKAIHDTLEAAGIRPPLGSDPQQVASDFAAQMPKIEQVSADPRLRDAVAALNSHLRAPHAETGFEPMEIDWSEVGYTLICIGLCL